MHTYIRKYIHTYMHAHIHTYIPIHMCICIYIYIHTYRYIHTCIYTHTHAQSQIHIHIHMHMHIHIHTIRTHTHTHQSQTQHIVRWLGWFCWPHWLTRMATGPGSRHRASSAWDLGGSLKADAVWQGPSADFERVLSACRCWTGQASIVVKPKAANQNP